MESEHGPAPGRRDHRRRIRRGDGRTDAGASFGVQVFQSDGGTDRAGPSPVLRLFVQFSGLTAVTAEPAPVPGTGRPRRPAGDGKAYVHVLSEPLARRHESTLAG